MKLKFLDTLETATKFLLGQTNIVETKVQDLCGNVHKLMEKKDKLKVWSNRNQC